MNVSAQPEGGWYPDPWAPATTLRWWNGQQWSEHVTPAPSAEPAKPQLRVGVLPHVEPDPAQQLVPSAVTQDATDTHHDERDPRFEVDRFVVRQRLRLIINTYEVFEAHDGAGRHPRDGAAIVSIRQRLFALRDRLDFTNEHGVETMHLQSQKLLDVHGRSELLDSRGRKIGALRKEFMASLTRSNWTVYGADDEHLLTVTETSAGLALWRRYIGMVPYVGSVCALIPIPYAFTITAAPGARHGGLVTNTHVGTYKRRIGLFDTYDLDVRGDASRVIDRRLLVALAIALDALQGR